MLPNVEVLHKFEAEFLHGDKYGSIYIPLHAAIQFDQHHLLKNLDKAFTEACRK